MFLIKHKIWEFFGSNRKLCANLVTIHEHCAGPIYCNAIYRNVLFEALS
jgi:hypothetical protein